MTGRLRGCHGVQETDHSLSLLRRKFSCYGEPLGMTAPYCLLGYHSGFFTDFDGGAPAIFRVRKPPDMTAILQTIQ